MYIALTKTAKSEQNINAKHLRLRLFKVFKFCPLSTLSFQVPSATTQSESGMLVHAKIQSFRQSCQLSRIER